MSCLSRLVRGFTWRVVFICWFAGLHDRWSFGRAWVPVRRTATPSGIVGQSQAASSQRVVGPHGASPTMRGYGFAPGIAAPAGCSLELRELCQWIGGLASWGVTSVDWQACIVRRASDALICSAGSQYPLRFNCLRRWRSMLRESVDCKYVLVYFYVLQKRTCLAFHAAKSHLYMRISELKPFTPINKCVFAVNTFSHR